MKIRDFILSLVSWFILLVTVSCSDELGGERAPISSESNLHVLVPTVLSTRGTNPDDASGLPTYNATVDECQINDLTLYAFPTGNEGGKLLVETLPAPLATMMVEQHVANYQLNIEPGTYHIYVVANMNKVLSGQPIKTEDDLKNIVLDYRPTSTTGMPVCTNIPMIYEPKNDAGNLAETVINAAGDKYTEVAANLKFTCVKVKLNLIFDSSKAEFGGKTFSINSILAEKLSPFTHLYWGGKAPTWTNNEEKEEYKTGIQKTLYDSQTSETLVYYNDWSDNRSASATNNNDDIKGTGTAKDAPDNAAGKWLFQQTYYLPERYISSESDRSYLTIKGNVGGSVDNNYRINLGHKKDETSTVPVFPRGTFYEITGAIKTLGNMELDCKVSVKPWEMETISADFNHTTLWVSKTKASVTSTTADSIDYKSNVMLTEANFGCDEKVTTSSGEKDVIVLSKLDAVKNHRITFNINKDIQFSDYKGNYKGTAKVWIKAGNIKKYLNVAYDASPYFEVNPQEVTIYWRSDNNTKVVQFKTNLGGLAFTNNVTSSSVGKSDIQASCDTPNTPEGTFRIKATSDPVTTTVHYLTVQPKESAEGFKKIIKVTVKPAVGNYRINFRAINDRAHYKGGESNGTDNYKGTPEEKKEETYNGDIGNTNWADGWLDLSDDNDKRIYIPQTDNHRVYVYTQIGETTGAVASSKVWKFSADWPGNQMVADNTNVGWYYMDFSKDAQSISTDFGATGTRTIKPGETLIMFSNNTNTNWGFTLHRCPHHLEPGIPLFDYEDKEGWIVYDPTSDPTWNIYDDMPTIENINFTIYTKFQTYGWFNVYGAANGKNNDNNNTERESFTIYDTAGKSWSCENLNNGWYKTVITLKAVKGDHEKAIRIQKDNGESVLLFNGNSYEKYDDTGYYDGSWHAGKPF